MAQILIIEDDLTFSGILRGFLKKNGHEAFLTHNVKDGIAAVQDSRFDMLLLDYRLPDGTGLDVLQSIQQNKIQLPAIVMTSFNDVRTAVNAMRMGAVDYI